MRRLLLLGGVVAPSLYALADAWAGMRWDGYSFRDQTISELGAIGAPSRPLFSLLLILVYLLLVGFGAGIWSSAAGNRSLRIAGALLVGMGILALTVGQLAPMRMRGAEQGLTGALHLIEGGVAMVMLLVAMAFAAAALGRRFRLYTAATVAMMLIFGGWSATAAPRIAAGLDTPWVGVQERIFWYSYHLWFVVLAIALLRRQDRTERGVAPSQPAPTMGV